MRQLPKTLPIVELPKSLINSNAHWLAGEGAGSWFVLEAINNFQYKVQRYSPNGTFECGGLYQTKEPINLDQPHSLTYPSHCNEVNILQNDQLVQMTFIALEVH